MPANDHDAYSNTNKFTLKLFLEEEGETTLRVFFYWVLGGVRVVDKSLPSVVNI